jgi:hypothetical protein
LLDLRLLRHANVVRQAQAKGKVRPDGPGDATAPVKPDRRVRR